MWSSLDFDKNSLLTGGDKFPRYAHARIRLVKADTVIEIFTWIFCIHLDIFAIFKKIIITEITKNAKIHTRTRSWMAGYGDRGGVACCHTGSMDPIGCHIVIEIDFGPILALIWPLKKIKVKYPLADIGKSRSGCYREISRKNFWGSYDAQFVF